MMRNPKRRSLILYNATMRKINSSNTMSSCCRRRQEDVFSDPKFFKIIAEPLAHNLRIPTEFMRRHGRNLGNRVFLKVPSREVELTRSNGGTLLQKGWKEFSEHHSLDFAHFLMFEYNGDSHFRVLIFDRTATDINYPDFEEEPSGTSDSDVEVLPHFPPTPPETKIVQDSGRVQKKRKKETYIGIAYQRAMDYAAAATFDSPFFISIIRPSHINSADYGVEIQRRFARRNIYAYKSSSVTLWIKKKKWAIKVYCDLNRARFAASGWKVFVRDNGLEVGDACIFQVASDFHFDVLIFKS